jgi:hypothetical protein
MWSDVTALPPRTIAGLLAAIKRKHANAWLVNTAHGPLQVFAREPHTANFGSGDVVVTLGQCHMAVFPRVACSLDHFMFFPAYIPRTESHAWILSALLAEFAPRRKLIVEYGEWNLISDSGLGRSILWPSIASLYVPFDDCNPGAPAYGRCKLQVATRSVPSLCAPDLEPLGPNGIPPGPTTMAEIAATSSWFITTM